MVLGYVASYFDGDLEEIAKFKGFDSVYELLEDMACFLKIESVESAIKNLKQKLVLRISESELQFV